MAMTSDDDDTIEANGLSASLDPYGQLVKMLMPRASCIAIYDRSGMPLWLSDGYEGPDLLQLVEELLAAARTDSWDPEEHDGLARSWDGETGYVFILSDQSTLLGALGISCQDGSSGARPFSLLQGLLRPVLQVLGRELSRQNSVTDPRKDVALRDSDLELLVGAGAGESNGSEDLEQLLSNCVAHLDCALGALLVPDKKIAISRPAQGAQSPQGPQSPMDGADVEALEKMQGHLFAWMQVQRRTLILNKAPPSSPLGALPYKILACPIRNGAQPVAGVLLLFKRMSAGDFDTRQVSLVEMMTRRVARVLRSAYDPATGLLTRAAFEQRVLAALAAADAGSRHCVAYADVDRLHVINENHGMHIGDEAIQRIAQTIRTRLGSSVAAARIAGDRFALFFPGRQVETARPLLDELCGAIGSVDFSHEERKIALSMSFGMAAVADAKRPLSHALAAAELACKSAKDRGRGHVEPFPGGHRNAVRHHEDASFDGFLREAIANGRFRMEAQPIVQLDRQEPGRRFELLLRMIDRCGESIAPQKFLGAAERLQLAADIDRWVVQHTLEILSCVAATLEDLGARFAINVGAQALAAPEFLTFLDQRLREFGLPPGLLSFEISESAAVANIVRAEALIRRLQELGHAIALGNFGRGPSSLTYLESLPVSDLKIDGTLVRELVGNPSSHPMLSEIVQLARRMQLTTTAECIESEAILSAAAQLGVDFGQGFAIGRPQPLEIVLQELLSAAAGPAQAFGAPRLVRVVG